MPCDCLFVVVPAAVGDIAAVVAVGTVAVVVVNTFVLVGVVV